MRRMDTEDAIAAAGFEKRVQEFAFRKAQREDKVNAQADTHTLRDSLRLPQPVENAGDAATSGGRL